MEIERKWMVNGWPEGEGFPALPLKEEFAMRQGYISVHPTVRIRKKHSRAAEPTISPASSPAAGWRGRRSNAPSIKPFEDLETKIIAKPLIPSRSAAATFCRTGWCWK